MADCPVCGRPTAPETRPFCSPRCKQVDLNRWLSEVYRVPAETPQNAKDDDTTD